MVCVSDSLYHNVCINDGLYHDVCINGGLHHDVCVNSVLYHVYESPACTLIMILHGKDVIAADVVAARQIIKHPIILGWHDWVAMFLLLLWPSLPSQIVSVRFCLVFCLRTGHALILNFWRLT